MSMACCCDAANPYVCPTLGGGSGWINQCNSVEQMVWKMIFWACEISGPDCVPGAGSCTYDHEEVVLVYDGASGLYAPKDGSVTATLETQTVAGQVQWRVSGLNLPGATYESDGLGGLIKTGGDCCYSIGFEVIETRRIWDSATAATQNFDCELVGLVDSDCTDCDCYNTAVTTDTRAFYHLFGGYYFLGLFAISYRPSGCIVPGINERSRALVDISIGLETETAESNLCIDCDTLELTACHAYSGTGSWSVGRKDSVTFDGTTYHECNHGGPSIGYVLKCSNLHPVNDPITSSEWCKVSCDNGEGGGCICDSATLALDEA